MVVMSGLLAAVGTAGSHDGAVGKALTPKAKAILAASVGDPDPAAPLRMATHLSAGELVTAFFKGNREEQLSALDAAGYLYDPWPVLPYLAALMTAKKRRIASRAASALLTALQIGTTRPEGFEDVIPKQASQLADQLHEHASDVRLDVDIRAAALTGIDILKGLGYRVDTKIEKYLEDAELAIRESALGLVDLPLSKSELANLARVIIEDADKGLKAQAAALLCENALAHGVKTPSEDLTDLLEPVVGDAEAPAGGITGILSCLSRFESVGRLRLVDTGLKHPDPAVKTFWEAHIRR